MTNISRPRTVKKKFKSSELDDLSLVYDGVFQTKLLLWFRVKADCYALGAHRLAGGEPTSMERIFKIIDDERLWRNIPGYHKLYKINEEGVIYNTMERKFLIQAVNQKMVSLELSGQTEHRVVKELVRFCFGDPEPSDDEYESELVSEEWLKERALSQGVRGYGYHPDSENDDSNKEPIIRQACNKSKK